MQKLVTKCPKCGHEGIPEDDWEYDEETATREVECSNIDCGFMWVWVFTASHSESRSTGELVEQGE